MGRGPAILVFTALASLQPEAAGADTIQLVILSQPYLSATGLQVQLDVRNNGDTAARNVLPIAAFRGDESIGTFVPALAPATSLLQTISIPLDQPERLRGVWPLVIRLSYVDGNNHPFEALHVITVPFDADTTTEPGEPREPGLPPPAAAELDLSAGRLSTTGDMTARLTSRISTNASLTFIVPEGLAVTPEQARVFLRPGTRRVSAFITNVGATDASRLPVFAVLEYEAGGEHATTIAGGVVEIVAARDTRARWMLGLALGVLLAAWAALVVRSWRSGRT